MYTGLLWLDFEQDHYSAKISRCVFGGENIAIEFMGTDEGLKFSGNCRLSRQGDRFIGSGSFVYSGGNPVSSTVIARVEKNGSDISLHGTWTDQGDSEPHILEAELQELKSPQS